MPAGILGINARNLLYIKPSLTKRAARVLDNKLLTKKILTKAGLPVPKTYAVIKSPKSFLDFEWESLPGSFALKPNRGLGGEGILVVFAKKETRKSASPSSVPRIWRSLFRGQEHEKAWIKADGSLVGLRDIKNHILNIIDGRFSIGSLEDSAFFEERIKMLKIFKSYSYKGIPDIRVIVYNSVPVMAELRIPTEESQGKANLHLGAIGVGIDMGNGTTTHATHHDRAIHYIPHTRLATGGIKIPEWDKILELAVKAQRAVRSDFIGADISIDRDRGPIILELNARPGLSIQNANNAPLKERLMRVKGLMVQTPKKGAQIGQDLFGGGLEEELEELSGKKVIGAREEITLYGAKKEKLTVFAKIDTGAYRTTVSAVLAEKLGLTTVIKYKKVRGALGKEERPIVDLTFDMDNEKIKTEAFIADREEMKHDVIIGRRDLKKFLVNPTKNLLLKSG